MVCIMSDAFETDIFIYGIIKEAALLVFLLRTGLINSAISSSGLCMCKKRSPFLPNRTRYLQLSLIRTMLS